jgi:hypothetical protein
LLAELSRCIGQFCGNSIPSIDVVYAVLQTCTVFQYYVIWTSENVTSSNINEQGTITC